MRRKFLAFAIMMGLAASSSAAMAVEPANAGRFNLDLRLRSETVADDAFVRDADALTLRARFGYRTPVKSGWSGFVEIEGTTHLSGDGYNSSDNGQVAYPAISDPDNAELNQAYVNYAPSAATRVTVGRQRIIYDNQRFFGSVGWRQNEQSFDALDAQHRFGNGTTLRYSYLDRAQRIFGAYNDNRSLARWQLDAHLLSLSHAVGPGTLTGYAHLIDNQTLPLASHRNLGLRYVARHDAPDGVGWLASIEFAKQDDYADGSTNIDADYFFAEGGAVWRGHTFKAGWETLGGNGLYGFATPFATLHAFNGWDDRFLTTPVNGLQDTYLGWNRKSGKLSANVTWHDFRSDRAGIHYGREWDASLGWAFAPRWNALVKLADYRADDVGSDVLKTWVSVEYVY